MVVEGTERTKGERASAWKMANGPESETGECETGTDFVEK